MFKAKQEVCRQIDAVYALTLPLNRTDILTHDAIRKVLHLEPHQKRWHYVMFKVKDRLERERGITTWTERTVGYRLLTIEETLQFYPVRRYERAATQLQYVRVSGERLPERDLSLNQRRRRALSIRAAKEAQETLRETIRRHEIQSRPSEPRPRAQFPK